MTDEKGNPRILNLSELTGRVEIEPGYHVELPDTTLHHRGRGELPGSRNSRSGSPCRSRGPGSNSRKKSASWASKDRRPFGTILMGLLSDEEMGGVVEPAAASEGEPARSQSR